MAGGPLAADLDAEGVVPHAVALHRVGSTKMAGRRNRRPGVRELLACPGAVTSARLLRRRPRRVHVCGLLLDVRGLAAMATDCGRRSCREPRVSHRDGLDSGAPTLA